jgi:predicted RNA binding protein YcfA (HicA-like mRNA interferase family)
MWTILMSKRKKRLEKLRRNPKNVSFEELRRVLEDYGFELHRVRGSHHVYQQTILDKKVVFIVPYQRGKLPPVYVEDALDLIDSYFKDQEQDDDTDE